MLQLRCGVCVMLLTIAMLGCSDGGSGRPTLVPVTGVIKYKGQPVDGAVVTFMSDSSPRTASGVTNAGGEFELSTYSSGDGAPVGKHSVAIAKTGSAAEAKPMDARGYAEAMRSGAGGTTGLPTGGKLEHQLPAKFANPKESGLSREVIEGDVNHFEFDLTD